MSLGAYSTVSFDERGHRHDEQCLACRDGNDTVEVCKTTVRLDDGVRGVEGEIESGRFWWRCFSGYVERTDWNGVMLLVTHARDGRSLLAVTETGDVSRDQVEVLIGEFFDRACCAMEFDAEKKAVMRVGFWEP